jgi:hypothetical protein
MDDTANEGYAGTSIGAVLPLWTGRPILGGPEGLPFAQQTVDLTNGVWLGQAFTSLAPGRLAELLDRYAVHWIVAVTPASVAYLSRQTSVVSSGERWGRYVTFMRLSPAALAEGATSVELDIGRISVRGAALPVTSMALHWHQRLRSVPPLPIARVVYPEDPVGLIRVHNGNVRDFVLRCD